MAPKTLARFGAVVGTLFAVINALSFFAFSDGHGVMRVSDGIKRVGWPFLIFEEGGFSWHRSFYLKAVCTDLAFATCLATILWAAWSFARRSSWIWGAAERSSWLRAARNGSGTRRLIPFILAWMFFSLAVNWVSYFALCAGYHIRPVYAGVVRIGWPLIMFEKWGSDLPGEFRWLAAFGDLLVTGFATALAAAIGSFIKRPARRKWVNPEGGS